MGIKCIGFVFFDRRNWAELIYLFESPVLCSHVEEIRDQTTTYIYAPQCLAADKDNDFDGIFDLEDAFPFDPDETIDTDLDGVGNNADTDDDNDGVADATDAFPLNAAETLDTDRDGIGNNADTDDDGDGVEDDVDAFSLDKNESVDTDGDGIGNNADTDDDGDGVLDAVDAYALISLAGRSDTDGDGYPDNCDSVCVATGMTADADDDNDGVGDNSDVCPEVANADQTDTDADGYGDACDLYPEDPNFWSMKIEDALAEIVDDTLRGCVIAGDVPFFIEPTVDLQGKGAQVSEITGIQCNPPIATLSGLENFKALRALVIDDLITYGGGRSSIGLEQFERSTFSDLSPLSSLTKLEQLQVPHAQIIDLKPISNLSELRFLDIRLIEQEGARITDITALNQLTKLDTIWLDNHAVKDLQPLLGLTQLKNLNLRNNEITSLVGLPRVESYQSLWLDGNPIADFSTIDQITVDNLFVVSVENESGYAFINQYDSEGFLAIINNDTALPDFSFLLDKNHSLFACLGCRLDDPSRLSGLVSAANSLQNLWYLGLVRNNIVDTRPLSSLTFNGSVGDNGGRDYTVLDLTENSISDLSPLIEINVFEIRVSAGQLLCSHLNEFRDSSNAFQVASYVEGACLPDDGDSDGDGYINISDAFPTIATEWSDLDGDYIGDNIDDSDEDGVVDGQDDFPLDPAASVDTDGDGMPDDWNPGYSASDSVSDPLLVVDTDDDNDGVLDTADAFPLISLGSLTDTDGDGRPNDCDSDCKRWV